MDFLEDIERYERSMQNAYGLITKEITLDDGSTTIEKNNLCSTTNNLCKYTDTYLVFHEININYFIIKGYGDFD
mgnify:CR=1 FL=1